MPTDGTFRALFKVNQNVYVNENLNGLQLLTNGKLMPIKNAAQLAGVHENILGFPEQYQTVVGERGVTLSGGQKQRISIARAILSDPEIVLLDDCLSAVDVETDEFILANLKKEMQSRTSIIVSHRVSSIKHADIIMHLRNGEITEMGNHEELLKLNGNYAKLFDMQKN